MSNGLGLIIESLVAVLLLLTISFCVVLNARLKKLKADEHALKGTIAELITATEIAERAIAGLKMTVRDCDQNLGAQLAMANELTDRLKKQTLAGEEVLHRLSRIALAARPLAPAEGERQVKPAKSIAAAAQAFADRRKASGLAA